jgi:2-keto-4-pentenoate hydratase
VGHQAGLNQEAPIGEFGTSPVPLQKAWRTAMTVLPGMRLEISDKVYRLRGAGQETAPFTSVHPGFSLDDAYWVVEDQRRRREAAGDRIVGRKIGFTNRAAWAGYGISGPIWNYLYERTTWNLGERSRLSIAGWPNVRMETEMAFGLCAPPDPGMDEEALLACIEWAALDFEVCTSIFPDWTFKVADAAATGVHVGLFLGPRRAVAEDRPFWRRALGSFSATLACEGGNSVSGGGSQVLGSPLAALAYLVRELDHYGGVPLQAGDIVTTGTLTTALPALPGQRWRAQVSGIPLDAIVLDLEPMQGSE